MRVVHADFVAQHLSDVKQALPNTADYVQVPTWSKLTQYLTVREVDLVVCGLVGHGCVAGTVADESMQDAIELLEHIPCFVYTSLKHSEDVQSLYSYAWIDDFLVAPVQEQILRLALSRTIRKHTQAHIDVSTLTVGELILSYERRAVQYRSSSTTLTPKEYLLLHQLMLQAGKIVSRYQIADYIWPEDLLQSNTIESLICRVRRKLHIISAPYQIRSMYKIGYLLEAL